MKVYRKTNERIMKFALGSDWRRAKFAARYLAFSKNKDELCNAVVEVTCIIAIGRVIIILKFSNSQ